MRRAVVVALTAALFTLPGCLGDDKDPDKPRTPRPAADAPTTTARTEVSGDRPEVEPYEPDPAEEFLNGKRLAGRLAQRAVTYRRGADAREIAASLGASGMSRAHLARVLAPLVDPAMRSSGEVVYPQLSGATHTSLGAMVLVRQTLEDAEGRRRSRTRVLDIRLRRSGGPWSLDRIASVGGAPVKRPDGLSRSATRVLDSPNISLSDSARWDIYRGQVDDDLLTALAEVAKEHELSIGILKSGHPRNVWATDRVSAHSAGSAADIFAVDGRLVIHQQRAGSAAYRVAQAFLVSGARQVGSPWALGGGGRRSFTDQVHQDHIHVQQAGVAGVSDRAR